MPLTGKHSRSPTGETVERPECIEPPAELDRMTRKGVAACWFWADDGTVKTACMNHSEKDQVSLELARRVAERLRWQPELVAFARANLARWSRQNLSAPSLLRCYAEWQEILARPVDEICNLLCAESADAQRLRQNSPFAGVLSPAEVWELKSRFHHAPATA